MAGEEAADRLRAELELLEAMYPEAITATGPRREDLRSAVKEAIAGLQLAPDEEVLDAIILSFQELLASCTLLDAMQGEQRGDAGEKEQCRTVVIWLHHLLNTNKRKLALNPTVSSPTTPISGLTKPGYPGILVFSGPKASVDAHVGELRAQRWQAFQVRYDSQDTGDAGVVGKGSVWSFEHSTGIREVESMSDIVQGTSDAGCREIFLDSVGVR